MDTPTKICSICKQELPATLEYFAPHKEGKYGLHSRCRECNKEYKRQEYQRNKATYKAQWERRYEEKRDELIEYQRRYREENPKVISERKRRYRQENPGKVREQVKRAKAKKPEHYRKLAVEGDRRRRDANPEKYKVKNTEQSRKWRAKHPDYKPPSKGKFNAEHPEEMKEYRRQWKRRNPEKIKATNQARRAAKMKINGSHTAEDIKLQYKSQRGKCWHCGVDLEGKYHVDHLIPFHGAGQTTLGISCWPVRSVTSARRTN